MHKWGRYGWAQRVSTADMAGQFATCPQVDRVNCEHLSVEQFIELYEKPYVSSVR